MNKSRKIKDLIVIGLSLIFLLSACSPAQTPIPVSPTVNRIVVDKTSTPTTVWFPPTPTFTQFPTPRTTPTKIIQPDIGDIILRDDFTDGSYWDLSKSETTSAALGNNKITLALTQTGDYLFSLRNEPVLNNFYIEITVQSSLCLGKDEFGLLLRVTPNYEFYRFSLSCDGHIRLDKYFQGHASSPQPWKVSGTVPPGAPSSARLAAWLNGKEMKFYVNDVYQFGVQDSSINRGQIGVFTRSAGDNAVTISFSELEIYQVSP